ncbi:MAG TPA: acyl-CoA dehydrogenase family protein, partial [Candidatus Dormibacteraeota bacterium]|nr:acyl-CoA dehydrogenase family protein [Candidatus Dormibacteraeota bacterium]
MRVGLDPLQEQIAQALRRALARHADPWAALVELDALAFGVPAALGGLNLGQRAAVLAAEELGRVLATGQALDAMLAADALAGAGASSRLEAVAGGRMRCAAVGLAEPLAGASPPELAEHEGGWTLGGRGLVAVLPHEADALLLAAGGRVFLAPTDRPGWSSRPLDTTIPRGLHALSLTALRLAPDDELPARLDDLVARGRLRQAAFLLGVATAAHEAAVGHARRRRQFGQRLLDFQAIGMRLAALAGRLAALRLLIQRAAWLADTDAPEQLRGAAAECLAMAAELALDAARDGIQVHGAAGTAHASAAQRCYRVALVEAARWGRPGELWREAGRDRLAARARPA